MATLASDRELAALKGELADEVQNPDDYQRKARYRIRQRIERLEHELSVLEEIEPGLADTVRARILHDQDDDIAVVLGEVIEAESDSIDVDQLRRELKGGDHAK